MALRMKRVEKGIMITLLILGGLLMMVPFIWMIGSSFKPENEFTVIPPTLFPNHPTFNNYRDLFVKMDFLVYLKNTLIIVLCSFVGLFLNAMAGYAFAKFDFPGRNKFFYIILATMMIPGQVTMIPTYLIINQMGLVNTMAGIVLPGLVGAFAIFLFRQFMTTIPIDLLEAARLDGAGEFRIFFQLIVPIVKPVFAVQGILTFIGAWNSFLWPLIIANDERLYTLSVGLSLLKGQYGTEFGLQMAGAAFMVIPIIIIFIFFQKHIIEGYTISGIK
ncbi:MULTISPECIES: carbohydrate ABC transporter permease [unclassified Paenibacillus]|uniref:carbohydrate ABC transporter permease n=1 Tax=unclassified Paenibacillus TaxID=185978 RepID=UPI0024060885|nr:MULTISPECIES: carbohydrate ABC transporter permease [unclassified Paenibacillus]MDF9845433.1 multiple sugar transport system permease protein [Paenibacillus sp. PastF-2]MDF9852017.1 multiple sugar transport system permease protein [Paenibacillus sp. PastM-2]MDF9858580.1 multiple sugar transport system permease protein [Paenibacillus sp. PastF-1]MDH6483850.1 multiple sugar transport system permease protein [Paenibacillus sp. PastH-2]MDH6511231.1 multiple sugar transport system permease prote